MVSIRKNARSFEGLRHTRRGNCGIEQDREATNEPRQVNRFTVTVGERFTSSIGLAHEWEITQ